MNNIEFGMMRKVVRQFWEFAKSRIETIVREIVSSLNREYVYFNFEVDDNYVRFEYMDDRDIHFCSDDTLGRIAKEYTYGYF